MKTIKIKYTQKLDKSYPALLCLGAFLVYAFIRGVFWAKSWGSIFGEALMLLITILVIYYGYKGYQKRDEVEYFDREIELRNVKKFKVTEVKK
jgi:hypothetical protein